MNSEAMHALGMTIGKQLVGGEVIELVGDVGAGKTTLTKGIAAGMGVDEDVQSPSFTISRVYDADHDLRLAHYDFYRLHDPGIMADELRDTMHDPHAVTVVEWADIVTDVLPVGHIRVRIKPTSESSRSVVLEGMTV